MDSLDVNDTFERLITNLKMRFCHWRNPTNVNGEILQFQKGSVFGLDDYQF